MIDSPNTISGVDVSRETMDKLTHFVTLIEKWTKRINLIAPTTVPDIWNRHIVDSAQVFKHAPKSWQNWVDLGSGGGLPGIVVAILDAESRPITLIESDTRKCLFLNTVRRELSLNINVLNQRIEKTTIERADVLTARALAPLSDLLVHAERVLSSDGIALFSKGETFQSELDQAAKSWNFEHRAFASLTKPEARVLEISRIRRRES